MTTEAKIKISGDPKDAQDAFKQVDKSAQQLSSQLSSIAATGAVAFAGLTATIGLTVAKFRVQEQAIFQQEAILKSTGFAAGFTSQELQKMASSLQQVTTFGDEAIISGQNILLTFKNIGKDVFPEVNKVMLDVASVMGTDLKSTAIQLGKALNDPTTGLTALTRVGITFTDQQKEQIKTLQKSGDVVSAQNIILKELQSQFGGAAEAATQGTGAFSQLSNVFGDLLEDIGKEFVPLLAKGAKALTEFLTKVRENSGAIKVFARILAAGAGMAAFVTVLATGAIAIIKVKKALYILRIGLSAGRIAAAAFTGALTLGLGFVIAFLPEIIAFAKKLPEVFNATKDQIIGAFANLGKNLINIGAKIGIFLKNLFTFNFAEIKSSAQAVKDAVSKAIDQTFKDVGDIKQKVVATIDVDDDKLKEEQDKRAQQKSAFEQQQIAETEKAKKEETAKLVAEQQRQNAIIAEQQKIQKEIIKLEKSGASQEVIRLKEQEIASLRALEQAKTAEDRELAQIRLDNFRVQAEEKRQEAIAQQILEREEKKELQQEFAELDEEDRLLAEETELENLNAQQLRRREVLIASAQEEQKRKKKEREQFIKDEVKFGKNFATINQAVNSQQVQLAKDSSNQLVALQQSKNNTLKSIGKAAAVTQIGIDSAQGAASIFAKLNALVPFAAPAIGAAGAAAILAFGAERIAQVGRAQEGGVVPGGGRGDIFPALLEPGEIVVPRALAPTFEQQFSLSADPENQPSQSSSTFNFGTIIGTEEFVNNQLIPAIKDAKELENADIGVA